MFLLAMMLYYALASDVPKQATITITSCPASGHFFTREMRQGNTTLLEPGACYLCFCDDSGTAVCGQRQSKKCDGKDFVNYKGRIDKHKRNRRSPVGLSDLFFKDSVADFFNKRDPEQCKPFESSHSIGCPPADWCIGCTVCDCDANGRWDCHVLSFCPGYTTTIATPSIAATSPTHPDGRPRRRGNRTLRKMLQGDQTKLRKVGNQPPYVTNDPMRSNPPNYYGKFEPKMLNGPVNANRRPFRGRMPKVPMRRKNRVATRPIHKNLPTTNKVLVEMGPSMELIKNENKTVKTAQKVVQKVMNAVMRMLKMQNEVDAKHNNKQLAKRSPPGRNSSRITTIVDKNKRQINKKKQNKKLLDKKSDPKRKHGKKYQSERRSKRDLMSVLKGDETVKPRKSGTTIFNMVKNKANTTVIGLKNVRSDVVNSSVYYLATINNENKTLGNYYRYALDTSTTEHTTVDSAYDVFGQNTTESYGVITIDHGEVENRTENVVNEAEIQATETTLFVDNQIHKSISTITDWVKNNESTTVIALQEATVTTTKETKEDFIRKLLTESKNKKNKMNLTEIQANLKKFNGLGTVLDNFVKTLKSNSTVDIKKTGRLNRLVQYIKESFMKLFMKYKAKKKSNSLKNNEIIINLCKTFGPCRLHRAEKRLLQRKLKYLEKQSRNIMSIIRIIKGLLHLINYARNCSDINKTTKQNDEIDLLDSILRGTYKNNLTQLSSVEKSQVEYLRSNTNDFIQSVDNFTSTLNDIIDVLKNKKNKSLILENTTVREEQMDQPEDKAFDIPVRRLKNLLIKFNLIDNTFMKNMYKAISLFENKSNSKEDLNQKVSETPKHDSERIENYTMQIMSNLRKLRDLAFKMTSRSRTKREANYESMEFLLSFMEYLLKQSNVVINENPVNDGIDVLIEAIKNAPPVTPIVMKYENVPDTRRLVSNDNITSSIELSSSDSDSKESTDLSLDKGNSIQKLDEDMLVRAMQEYVPIKDEVSEPKTEAISTTRPNKVKSTVVVTKRPVFINVTNNMPRHTTAAAFTINLNKFKHNITIHELGVYDDEDSNSDQHNETLSVDVEGILIKNENNALKKVYQHKDDVNNKRKPGKMEWIDQSYEQDSSDSKLSNPTTTVKTSSKVQTLKPAKFKKVDIFAIEKKKKKKLNSKELLIKKQKDLLDSLDYGAHKGEFGDYDKPKTIDDSDSISI